MSETNPTLTIAVCTRDRPEKLRATLDALERGASGIPLMVVDQSGELDAELARRAETNDNLRLILDAGEGLSRARNLALDAADADWVAFVDDDCLVAHDFADALLAEIGSHREADWMAGDVTGNGSSVMGTTGADSPAVTTFPVDQPLVRRGARTLPGAIGFGVLFCVRRATAERLGGWDERFGPGVPDFPAADDMDFNYRLLKGGGTAVLSPRVRAVHDQWRSPQEVVELQRGYSRAWAGFCAKHLRGGDARGALRLWAWGAVDVLDMTASALRRRSVLRGRIAVAKLHGLIEGTARGLRMRW